MLTKHADKTVITVHATATFRLIHAFLQ